MNNGPGGREDAGSVLSNVRGQSEGLSQGTVSDSMGMGDGQILEGLSGGFYNNLAQSVIVA